MDTNQFQALVETLTGLRRDGRQMSGLAADLTPPDEATAYRAAWDVRAALGWEVGGWKIAAFKKDMQRQLRAEAPIYGPVYRHLIAASPHTVQLASQCSPIPEAEFVAKLGANLPPRDAPYTRDEAMAAVASFHPGIELAECRFVHDDNFPPLPAILADGAGGGGLVYGPEIADWRNRDLSGQTVRLLSDGRERRQGNAGDALGHPIEPVLWLANTLSRRGIGLEAGQVISTGTLTGMLAPKAGETFVADFGEFGAVSATYA